MIKLYFTTTAVFFFVFFFPFPISLMFTFYMSLISKYYESWNVINPIDLNKKCFINYILKNRQTLHNTLNIPSPK